jgi:hypothetical protein
MASISCNTVLDAVVVAVILAALPHAIHRIVQTGAPYLFTGRFFQDILARLSGPGRLRFIVQPIVAMLLGARSGIQDAHAGLPPFLWALAFHGAHRRRLLKSAFASIRSLVAIAILLDVISQFLIFHEVCPGVALLVGPALITLPYVLVRALTNRVMRWRSHRAAAIHMS